MTLDKFLTQLSYGPFSNLSLGNDGDGTIKADKIPMVVDHINEGLLRMYTRLVLRENSVIIEMMESRTRYPLNSKHALSNTESTEDKFIMDNPDWPFQDDVIKIMEVMNDLGCRLEINNPTACYSTYTPKENILQVPNPIAGRGLSIVYQAKHPKLDYAVDPEGHIDLTDNLIGALQAYVAYKVYGNMNTQEALLNSQKYQAQYTEIVAEVLEMDTVNMSYSQTNTKFQQNGYV